VGGSRVEGNLRGISSVGSHIQVGPDTEISNNTEHGVNAMNGTNLSVRGAIIQRNGVGVFLNWGSTAQVANARVINNTYEGAIVNGASVLAMTEDAVVENNSRGVAAFESATVQVNRTSSI
jgi:nitrous oxidase accessory protein NosD